VENAVVQKTAVNMYTVQAQSSIHDINHHLPHPIEMSEDYTTLAGAIIHHLKRIPAEDDLLQIDDYEIRVVKMDTNSIEVVQVKDLL
jgi:CBS domain containing-hemolysin-like protein